MKINHAVLHVLDFDSAVNILSTRELALETRSVRGFVTKHLSRARSDADNRRCPFDEGSAFADELKRYFYGEREFLDLSLDIADFLSGELSRADKLESTDILVADFDDDDDVHWFGVLLLSSRMAFMHEVDNTGSGATCDIARRYAVLPNPSQKLSSYALVRASNLEILYRDVVRSIAGQDRMVLPEGLLQCGEGVSSKAVIDTVTQAVAQAAEDHGANPATAVAAVKAAVAEKVETDGELPPWDVIDEALEDEPVLREAAKEILRDEKVPERVQVESSQVERSAVRNIKIRTDTGIDITVPASLANNPDYVSFTSEPNGLISIELRNIGHIENR